MATEFVCPNCGRTCKNAAGFSSHRRKCERASDETGEGSSKTAEAFATKGQAFYDEVVGAYELSVVELRTLEDICREIDLIERLQVALDRGSLIVPGSMGQPTASPLVQELRQHRAVLDRLMKSLALPDAEAEQGSRSESARDRAMKRWGAGGA